MFIKPGDQLTVTTANGSTTTMRALGSPEDGRDFPVGAFPAVVFSS